MLIILQTHKHRKQRYSLSKIYVGRILKIIHQNIFPQPYNICGYNKRTYYREVHSDTGHLKELEIEEQTKVKVSRRREIIKIRDIIEIQQQQKRKSIKPRNTWYFKKYFFEMVNKIDKPLARLTHKEKKITQMK